MNFLDEATIKTTPDKLAKVKAAASDDDTIEVMEKRGKDLDGDGDIDSDDYLAARDAAIKKAKAKKEEVEEGKLSRALGGIAVLAALLGINKATSERIYNSDPKIKAATEKYEKAKEAGDKEAMAKFEKEIKKRKLAWDAGRPLDEAKNCGCGKTPCKTYGKMKEDKQIKVDADQKFVIDLKHLMQKHGKEDTIKITKKLMKQLHDKGEVSIDGTKIMFKELDAPQDAQLALPEPDAPDFLGADGKDYEGGMAKSQMLKMKNYAKALCDMIDDETQLEAWVQAKLTKASDYMSSVYHYLDYQKSKMNETIINGKKVDPRSLEGEDNMFTYAEFTDGTRLTDDELDQLTDDYDTLYSYFGPGGVGHTPRSDF